MHHHYKDIRALAGDREPVWFDEYAVPRYCPFSTSVKARIYADRVALVLIRCQNCGHEFKVCFSSDQFMRLHEPASTLWEGVLEGWIHYGDPPNIECCPAGPTMNSEAIAVLEAWEREPHWTWVRKPEYERVLTDDEEEA